MLIIPSIDLLNGACVRLAQGSYSNVTVYSEDPAEIAQRFVDAGAVRIHVVDLDAARGKGDTNRKEIERIRKSVSCTIEVGGGVRTETDIRELMDIGVERLVVGTIFAKNPDTVADWIRSFGKIFIAGIDAFNGSVKVAGWENDAGMADTDLSCLARDIGISGIIYTNISRDGMLSGPDIERTRLIAQTAGLPVIVSGGISSEADFEAAAGEWKAGIAGAITGKAFYEGRIDLKRVIARFQRKSDEEVSW